MEQKHILKLTEKPFASIQGEGLHTGIPCVFVRLSGCTLKCEWCDTAYSRDISNSIEYDYNKLTEFISSISNNNVKTIIFTGGEPMMQQKEIIEFIKYFSLHNNKEYDFNFHIETNGTILPLEQLQGMIDFVSVSPKLTSSHTYVGGDIVPYQPLVLFKYAELFKHKIQFKFVVDNELMDEDIQEVNEVISRMEGYNDNTAFRFPVLIQPQGMVEDLKEYTNNAKCYVDAIIKDNKLDFLNKYEIRFLLQMHKVIWGDERGV